MAERRVPDVMHQRQSFGEIGVKVQRSGYGSRNLCDFQRMGQAVAEMVGISCSKNLRFCFQAAEGARVNYAVAVTRIVFR